MNRRHAEDSIRILEDKRIERENTLTTRAANQHFDSDSEEDSPSPIFDYYYEADGNRGICKMINFNSVEFHEIFESLRPVIIQNWNVGRGRKYKETSKDALFMLLTLCKHGGSWDFLGQMFKMQGQKFERMIKKFIDIIVDEAHNIWVKSVVKESNMKHLCDTNNIFEEHRYALEAIDVTFQPRDEPGGNYRDKKRFYSKKHANYGYKVEVAVRPNGQASGVSKHAIGATADIDILKSRIKQTEKRLHKGNVSQWVDDYPMNDKYPETWAAIGDKGYQGAANHIRMVTPYKKLPGRNLTPNQIIFNQKLAADRIIVENYFGRMKKLWNIVSKTFLWDEDLYDNIFSLCVSFTNVNIKLQPLKNGDGEWYENYLTAIRAIEESRKRKRSETQADYRERRKRRLGMGYRSQQILDGDSDAES